MPSLHREAEWAGLLKVTASHTVLAVQILRALRVLGESLARIWTAALRCARTARAIPPESIRRAS
jgi:hypothetical protein